MFEEKLNAIMFEKHLAHCQTHTNHYSREVCDLVPFGFSLPEHTEKGGFALRKELDLSKEIVLLPG